MMTIPTSPGPSTRRLRAARPSNGAQPPPMSKKRADFKRVLEPRLSNAVHDIYLVSLCADRQRYDYTDEDQAYVVERLRTATDDCISKFLAGTKKPVIKLPD